jgi:hypothetical protein
VEGEEKKLKTRAFKTIDRRSWICLLGVILAMAVLLYGEEGRTAKIRFNCLIDIETEPVDDYMTFAGSRLVPIIKATVSYQMAEGATPAESAPSVKYEELWYRADDPIGCVSSHQLGSRELALTQIRLSSKSAHPSQAEIGAQANALVRIYLDAYLRTGMVTSVVVPDEVFDSTIRALSKEKFAVTEAFYGSTIDPAILLPLESQSGKASAILRYNAARY